VKLQCEARIRARYGISRLEVVVILVVILVVIASLISLAIPRLLKARERSRQTSCANNMRQLMAGMRAYHDQHASLPVAAVWDVNATYSLALHESDRVDSLTRANWLQLILPQIDETELATLFDSNVAIGHPNNEQARTTWLSKFQCPSDTFHHSGNPHRFYPVVGQADYVEFARGNYAINGGTHNYDLTPPSAHGPQGDFCHLVMTREPRRYELWGNGVAGINKSFNYDDFANGQSSTIALEEIRAGVHELDPRGVWSLGQIASSITWGHGVNGDNFGPNNQHPRADDILRAPELRFAMGADKLRALGMPCVAYVDRNQQATARSQHIGGVNVAMLDGAVRFISDQIDPGLWHVLHSRETPSAVLTDWESLLEVENFAEDTSRLVVSESSLPGQMTNSLGVEFVKISSGTFEMGLPDRDQPETPLAPAHQVEITHDFLISIYEVTREQYAKAFERDVHDLHTATLPQTDITWFEAQAFCDEISQDDPDFDYRLPTEAEWEYVCRGGSPEPYDWQQDRQSDDRSGEAAGIMPPLPLTPVGSYPPNPFGVYDMRGNAWEWTRDWYDRDYYQRSRSDNPLGPAKGFLKVVRGSNWRFVGEPCLLDYPMQPPWKRNPFVGFRVVATPKK